MLVILFKIILVGIIAVIIAGAGAGFGMMKGILDNAPDTSSINIVPQGYRSNIRSQDGTVEKEISTIDSNRVYVYYDQIPKDMVKAADAAVNGRTFPCDIGAFNNDYFVYVAAFGLFTEVSYKTSQEWKNVLGHAAYILEGMRSLHDIPSFTMQVEYNNVRIQDEFIYGMISNSTSVGGFKGMTGKDVLLDDGVFEVTLIKKPRNPIELNEIIASLINLVDDTDMIYSFKSDEVEFMAREEVPWTLDGEFGGAHEEVIVKNICRAVDIMVPANK